MAGLNILSGGAGQGLVKCLAPTFRLTTGLDIVAEFGAVGFCGIDRNHVTVSMQESS
jgi:hypothetical protein